MNDMNKTQFFNSAQENTMEAGEILEKVYNSLTEKGYDPISQIVGYIMSGDPTYITSYNGARSMITKLERDEILEELVKEYIRSKLKA